MTRFQVRSVVVFVSFLAVCAVAILAAVALDVPKFFSLVRNARQTTGVVISKQRENHMLIEFKYQADSETLTSGGRAEDIARSFDSIQIGEEVPVYYDSSNPASATIGDPQKYLYAGLRGTAFVLVALTFCFFVYVLKRVW